MLKRFLLLFFLLGFGQVLMPGCNSLIGPTCRCPDVPKLFRPDRVQTWYFQKSGVIHSADATLSRERFGGIMLSWEGTGYSRRSSAPGGFFPSAYACDCVQPGHQGSVETIRRIEVKALTDYNDRFKAGSLLNAELTVTGQPDGKDLPLATFLQQKSPKTGPYEYLRLSFNQAPSVSSFRAEITVELSDGKTFVSQTPTVQLQ